MDLSEFTAKGFPGDIDQAIAETPVVSPDREQTQGMVRLCPETEPILYGSDFSPRSLSYVAGSRPELEVIVNTFPDHSHTAIAKAAMQWVVDNIAHPQIIGPLPPNRGLSEEDLIKSRVGWCNEQSRVFIALCQIAGVPARLCFLFHDNARCGHTVAEVSLEGKWSMFDVTFNLCFPLPDGSLAEARELAGPFRQTAHGAYTSILSKHYEHIQAFVEDNPGWNSADRPHPDRGGDLIGSIGICNYIVQGVTLPA